MTQEWNNVLIEKISLALYVTPALGKLVHNNRPFHGFVLNDSTSVKDYIFSDGHIMHTHAGSLFYLPKNSSYYVKIIKEGACYAINFDADIIDKPFSVDCSNNKGLFSNFESACKEWKKQSPVCHAAAMRAIYDCICQFSKAQCFSYIPSSRFDLIAPAIKEIERNVTNNEISVSMLAKACGISEVYFRKIFIQKFGVSPRDYIIAKRLEFAKQLLINGEFEVSKVAELSGYSEPCHFSREFKKRFGVSPKNITFTQAHPYNL